MLHLIVLPILGVLVVLIAGVVLYRWRQKRQEAHIERINLLFQDLAYAIDDHGIHHRQLVVNKLDAAARHIQRGEYEQAEYTLHDLLNIIRLS